MNKFLLTHRQQTAVLCDQASSVTKTLENTPKLMDVADSEHTKENPLLAPSIISDSVEGTKSKMLESCQTPTTDWS